jgi:hypothetical protein
MPSLTLPQQSDMPPGMSDYRAKDRRACLIAELRLDEACLIAELRLDEACLIAEVRLHKACLIAELRLDEACRIAEVRLDEACLRQSYMPGLTLLGDQTCLV